MKNVHNSAIKICQKLKKNWPLPSSISPEMATFILRCGSRVGLRIDSWLKLDFSRRYKWNDMITFVPTYLCTIRDAEMMLWAFQLGVSQFQCGWTYKTQKHVWCFAISWYTHDNVLDGKQYFFYKVWMNWYDYFCLHSLLYH